MHTTPITHIPFNELAASRSSIRSFDPQRPIKKDVLQRILEAGRLAPSAKNLQPWRFLVVRSPERLKKVQGAYPRQWLTEAPLILALTGRRSEAWTRQQDGYNSLETDLAIAMDHMILSATAEGVGTCWIAAFDRGKLKEALCLEGEDELFAFTPLGYPGKGFTPVEKNRRPPGEIIRYL